MAKLGKLFVLSAPSGSGKTTLCRKLAGFSSDGRKLVRSVSATTRSPRKGEKEARDYFFISPKEFNRRRKAGQFLEWARVLGQFYGTPRGFVQENLRRGNDVLLSIDVRGARQVRRKTKRAVLIFVLAPSFEELTERLKKRSTESLREISRRLNLAKQEMRRAKEYNYVVVNDKISQALARLKAIIRLERRR